MIGPGRRIRSGAIAPLAAMILAAVAGSAALAIDAGLLHASRRSLQALVDAAALSAARQPDAATAIAGAALARGDPQAILVEASAGVYTDDPGIAPDRRFVAGDPANAVRVVARREVPLGIGRLLTGQATRIVSAVAVAEHRPVAAFSIGSGTAALDAGALNLALSGLLGGGVSLSAMHYRGLLDARLGALDFLDALAVRLGLSVAAYRQLLASEIGLGDALRIAATVLAKEDPAAAASLDLLSQRALGGRTLGIGRLLSLAIHEQRRVGDFLADRPYAEVRLNAFDLATAAAALGGAGSAVALPGTIQLPALADLTWRLLVIEPPQSPGGSLALAPVGGRAMTRQARMLVRATLLRTVSGGVVTLPLLVEVAPAEAELRRIACQAEPRLDTEVGLRVTTGVARVAIGQVVLADFDRPGHVFRELPPAEVLRLTLVLLGQPVGVAVLARADASLGSSTRDLAFAAADIAAGTPQRVASGGLSGHLAASLAQRLTLTTAIDLGGVAPGLVGAVNGLLQTILPGLLQEVAGAITPVLQALDDPIDSVLAGIGLRLGFADVRVTGSRCGVAALAS